MTSRLPLSLRIGLTVALAALLAFLALRSSSHLQHISWMPRGIGLWADRNGVSRNVVAFFTLGFVTLTLFSPRVWLAFALCGFATALEVAQIWIPNRIFDWRDIAASIAGVLVAWPCAWLLRRRAA